MNAKLVTFLGMFTSMHNA